MQNLTKTQIAALHTATEQVVRIKGRNTEGRIDHTAPTTEATVMVIKGHRNGIQGLVQKGLAKADLAGLGDNHARLTEEGIIAALHSL